MTTAAMPSARSEKSRVGRIGAAACLVCLACLATGCAKSNGGGSSARGDAADATPSSARDDVAALQGRWVQQPEEGPTASKKQRVVKEVSGDTETVTTYDAAGQVRQAHTAKFRLERRGGVPVYTFYDRRITAGGEQGQAAEGPSSFVYKLRGDEFDEVWGLLPGQEQREVVIRRWKRAAN